MADLEKAVQDYKVTYKDEMHRCLHFYSIQRTLNDAIDAAALAKLPKDKRHRHQRRLKLSDMQQARDCLMTANLQECKDFTCLHEKVVECTEGIRGLGELYQYDVSLRIGEYLGLSPEVVYLHAGTRKGARALGLDYRKLFLSMQELPHALQSLTPAEAEDFLCIYKDNLRPSTSGCGSARSSCSVAPS
ncbi:MAG: hypothetical protein M1305_01830 [Candidatus Marsarchaeota archaeon]|nr:hypothetical protein [Candidatus Marsarchaeota archaeon]